MRMKQKERSQLGQWKMVERDRYQREEWGWVKVESQMIQFQWNRSQSSNSKREKERARRLFCRLRLLESPDQILLHRPHKRPNRRSRARNPNRPNLNGGLQHPVILVNQNRLRNPILSKEVDRVQSASLIPRLSRRILHSGIAIRIKGAGVEDADRARDQEDQIRIERLLPSHSRRQRKHQSLGFGKKLKSVRRVWVVWQTA
jgi:hypothetical protein